MIAARSPPRSEPANSHDLRPIATPRSARSPALLGQANPSVFEQAGERCPALEHVVERCSDSANSCTGSRRSGSSQHVCTPATLCSDPPSCDPQAQEPACPELFCLCGRHTITLWSWLPLFEASDSIFVDVA